MKLAYLAHIRIPTYKAHGVQILKTCEALAAAGASVRLIVPVKRHTVGGPADPFEYYGVKRTFTLSRIQSSDLLGLTTAFGPLFYAIDLLTFMVRAAGVVNKDETIYTREPLLLIPFLWSRHTTAVEVHELAHHSLFIPLLRRANKVITLTSLMKEDLIQRGIPAERITVAPDAIDLTSFQAPEGKVSARARLGLPADARIALYVGRLDGWKGLSTVYAAVPLLSDVLVTIIGGEEPALSRLKKEHPSVRFLGPRPYAELADNLAAADVVFLPNTGTHATSARHTSPLKLFAYMASGIPIVASDLPSVREVVNETMAFLVSPDSPDALAEGIRTALSATDEATQRGRAARTASEAYTWEKRAHIIISSLSA